jgi:putative transposase
VSPEGRRQAVDAAQDKHHLGERNACRIVGQPRGTQRYVPTLKSGEDELTRNIVLIASNDGRYGYRRVTTMLNDSGMVTGKDRIQRIWRREGLKVQQKQPEGSRLWLSDGSSIRLRPERPNHVWSFDVVEAATHDGRRIRLMTLIDEFSRKYLAIRVARRINAIGVIETPADAMLFEGVPTFIRSDNGPEMVAKVLRQWLLGLGTKSLYIEPGSPWENGHCESFISKPRDEQLNGEIFYSLREAKERNRKHAIVRHSRWHKTSVRPATRLSCTD